MGHRCVIASGIAAWSLVLVASLAAQPAKPTPREEAAKLKNPVPSNAASIATGQQLYQKYLPVLSWRDGRGRRPFRAQGHEAFRPY